MPKICICFYGLVQRSLKYTINSIETHIFKVLKDNNIDYDVYLHTYDASNSHSTRSNEYNVPINVDDYKLLKPDFYVIESYDTFNNSYDFNKLKQYNDPWYNNFESVFNWIREMNSHYQVTNLWEQKKNEYDFCLYLRADLMYITPLPILYLQNEFNKNVNKNILFTTPWGKSGGLNDFIGIGSCESMIIWGKRINNIEEYMKNIGQNSEIFIEYLCNKNNIENVDLPMIFYRVRANGNKGKEHWMLPEGISLKNICIKYGGEINDSFTTI